MTIRTNLTLDNRQYKRALDDSGRHLNRTLGRTGEAIERQTAGVKKFTGALNSTVGITTEMLGIFGAITGIVAGIAFTIERIASASERAADATAKELKNRREIASSVNAFSRRAELGEGAITPFDERRVAIQREAQALIVQFGGGGSENLAELEKEAIRPRAAVRALRENTAITERQRAAGIQRIRERGGIGARGLDRIERDIERARATRRIVADRDRLLEQVEQSERRAGLRETLGLAEGLLRTGGRERIADIVGTVSEFGKRRRDLIDRFGVEGAQRFIPQVNELQRRGIGEINRKFFTDRFETERAEREAATAEARSARRSSFTAEQLAGGIEADRLKAVGRFGAASALEKELDLAKRIFEVRENETLTTEKKARLIDKITEADAARARLARREADRADQRRQTAANTVLAELTAAGTGDPGDAIGRALRRVSLFQRIEGLGVDDPGLLGRLFAAGESSLTAVDPTVASDAAGFGGFGRAGLSSRVIGPGPASAVSSIDAKTGEMVTLLRDIAASSRARAEEAARANDPAAVTGGVGVGSGVGTSGAAGGEGVILP